MHMALNLKRERAPRSLDPDDFDLHTRHVPDAELALLMQRYQGAYQAALRRALAGLTARERTLLRMSILEGLTVERLGQIYRVHKTTTARWLREARAKLVERTFAELRLQLDLSEAALHSLNGVMVSRLELHFSELFEG
jgi:RNA polymerase sigma-70 factor (ECF subfamily)